MSTCHFIFSGCHVLLNLSDSEELKYMEGSLALSSQSITLSDYKWKGLGCSNVQFSTEGTLQNAWGILYKTKGSQSLWKTEPGVPNGQYMRRICIVEKLFLSINTFCISFCLFCFCRNCLLCFLNVIHIYQTAWFLTFRNIFSSNCKWSFDKEY